MLGIELPVAGETIDLVALIALGVATGFVAGFFGIGGGIIAVPMLHIVFGVHYNYAVGSSLAVIFGTAIAGTLRHRKLQQVDAKLGLLMFAGGFGGALLGTWVVQLLKHWGEMHFAPRPILAVNFVLPLVYAAYLVFVGRLFQRESARRKHELSVDPEAPFQALANGLLRRFQWRPRVSLAASGIEHVSVWVLVVIGFLAGLTAGLLGVGGGIVMVPAMIYILGMPTRVAVGTSLFMIILNSGVGTYFHATGLGLFSRAEGANCDIVLAACILAGSTVGAQLGAATTKRVRGVQIRHSLAYLAYAIAVVTILRLAHDLGLLGV